MARVLDSIDPYHIIYVFTIGLNKTTTKNFQYIWGLGSHLMNNKKSRETNNSANFPF